MTPAVVLAIAQALSVVMDGIMKELLSREDIKQGVRDEAAILARDSEIKALRWRIGANNDPDAHDRLRTLGGKLEPGPGADPPGGSV